MSSAPSSARRTRQEQDRLDTALADLFNHRITFNQLLGLQVLCSRADPGPSIRFDMRPELVGHYLFGRLHGGVISATLDAMGGFALMVAIGEKHASDTTEQIMHRFAKMGTIDLRVDYLRPGLGQHFIASATVTRLGGRIGSTHMALHNDSGTLIATGAAAYVIS